MQDFQLSYTYFRYEFYTALSPIETLHEDVLLLQRVLD